MSKITIKAGDEYRAKIATDWEKDSFFSDVYEKAKNIMKEFEDHVKDLREPEQKQGIQYRIGNNIIAFCGKRGQGKTSALQTFSHHLKKEKSGFYVLSSIDPSALRADESIVRILLSKLFNEIAKLMENFAKNDGSQIDFDDIRIAKDKILKKFEDCFRNVDYSVKDNENDFGMDDLELLSQLGSSNMLREKLQELIDEFIKFQSKYHEDGYRFLVIQIDDADMVLDGVFKICEDIRNYFSLPNVIVLMAADMEQLTNAIFMEYVKKYHDLISTEISDVSREYHLNNCIQMANRYIEKMYPAGHRIVLPVIQDYIKWNFNKIILEYIENDNQTDFFSKYNEHCKSIQEQLLKMLYDRTGMIFLKNDQNLHFILPRTMRELTHFVKMLYDLPTIDFEEAFIAVCDDTKKLQNNLNMLESYFFDDWCANHLIESDQITLKNTQKDFLKKELCANEILLKLKEVEKGTELYNAFIIYYTLQLNKKFTEVVGRPDLSTQLAIYLERFILDWNTDELMLLHFEYDLAKDNEVELQANLLFASNEDGNKKGTFNVEKVILRSLYNYDRLNRDISNETILSSTQDIKETAQDSTQDIEDKVIKSEGIGYVLGLKNLFANVEIYRNISENINKMYRKLDATSIEFCTLAPIYERLFVCMNLDKGTAEYLGIEKPEEDKLGSYWCDLYLRGRALYQKYYWNNDSNKQRFEKICNKYLMEYKKEILEFSEKIKDHIRQENTTKLIHDKDIMASIDAFDENFRNSKGFKELKGKKDDLKKIIQDYNDKINKREDIDADWRNEMLQKISKVNLSLGYKINSAGKSHKRKR